MDHDHRYAASVQVTASFCAQARIRGSACRGEPYHHDFVSWPTGIESHQPQRWRDCLCGRAKNDILRRSASKSFAHDSSGSNIAGSRLNPLLCNIFRTHPPSSFVGRSPIQRRAAEPVTSVACLIARRFQSHSRSGHSRRGQPSAPTTALCRAADPPAVIPFSLRGHGSIEAQYAPRPVVNSPAHRIREANGYTGFDVHYADPSGEVAIDATNYYVNNTPQPSHKVFFKWTEH